MIPVFEFVPIINDAGRASVRSVTFSGVSTAQGATTNRTDAGRLYGRVSADPAGVLVEVFNDDARQSDALVASATGSAGAVLSLQAENASGITGRVVVDSGTLPANPVFIVTFAVDSDVEPNADTTANFPGYDPTYGLAQFHAAAMRSILTSQLPAAVPQLYDDKKVSAFLPASAASAAMPDLLAIENPAALREAAAALAKAMSAARAEHLEEWALVARLAQQRFAAEMANIKAANARRPTIVESPASGVHVQTSEFYRG